MEKYERNIGLKTIYLTFARRFLYIILIFIPLGLVSFLAIHFGITKNYQSSSIVQKDTVFQAAHYQTFNSIVLSEANTKEVADNLVAANVTHANSSEITASEIKAGLSLSAFNSGSQSINITISFKSTDQSITKKVLDEVAATSVKSALTKDASTFKGLTVSSPASEGQDISSIKKYMLIALAADVVISLGIPFVWEIISDEVYDKDDVESLGCEGFTLKLSKK